jgi:hypothetical protein
MKLCFGFPKGKPLMPDLEVLGNQQLQVVSWIKESNSHSVAVSCFSLRQFSAG